MTVQKSNSENSLNNVNLADSILPDNGEIAESGSRESELSLIPKVFFKECRSKMTFSMMMDISNSSTPIVQFQRPLLSLMGSMVTIVSRDIMH